MVRRMSEEVCDGFAPGVRRSTHIHLPGRAIPRSRAWHCCWRRSSTRPRRSCRGRTLGCKRKRWEERGGGLESEAPGVKTYSLVAKLSYLRKSRACGRSYTTKPLSVQFEATRGNAPLSSALRVCVSVGDMGVLILRSRHQDFRSTAGFLLAGLTVPTHKDSVDEETVQVQHKQLGQPPRGRDEGAQTLQGVVGFVYRICAN
jgi:hypothetical protein